MPKPIKKRMRKKMVPQEELKSSYEKVISYMVENKKNVIIGAGVFIAIILLAVGIWLYRGHTHKQASQLEYGGYKLYHNLYQKDKKTDEERIKAALEKFKKSYEYKKSAVTLFYIANCYYDLGNLLDAEKRLRELNKKFSNKDEILPLSYYQLFHIYQEQGDEEKAIHTIKELHALNAPFYKDIALIQWANILSRKGKKEEAKEKYEELTTNHPDSPYADEARAILKTLTEVKKEEEKKKKVDKKPKP